MIDRPMLEMPLRNASINGFPFIPEIAAPLSTELDAQVRELCINSGDIEFVSTNNRRRSIDPEAFFLGRKSVLEKNTVFWVGRWTKVLGDLV